MRILGVDMHNLAICILINKLILHATCVVYYLDRLVELAKFDSLA